jgi:CRP/FNR family cyclic AMP-dependent transcriptional regulator
MGRTDAQQLAKDLSALPVFHGCTGRDLHDLATHAHRSSVPARWPLIHQETPADACYVILAGSAAVVVDGAEVARLDAGSVVGEVGVATHRLRNATVTSTTALDLLHIDGSEFSRLLERRPALRTAMLARAATMTA